MNLMLFRGLASRLLLSKRKVKEEPPAVISVTERLALTSADSGNTYSLSAALELPLRASLTAGWTIDVQCAIVGRYVTVTGAEEGIGLVYLDGSPSDGIYLDSLDATATITFNGSNFQVTVNSGTVTWYWV